MTKQYPIVCKSCNGSGKNFAYTGYTPPYVNCKACGGTGKVICTETDDDMIGYIYTIKQDSVKEQDND